MKRIEGAALPERSEHGTWRTHAVAGELLSQPWLAGALLLVGLLVAGLVYSVGLRGPLVLDDVPTLGALLDGRVPAERGWAGFLFSDALLGRPVSMATFIFNAATSGDDLAAWKRFNLLVHLLNALLVFWLSAQLWCWQRPRPDARGWFAGLAVGLVWLLHPLHVSTVLYTVQRMAELSALFVFAGLASYVAARKQQLQGGSGYLCLGLCFLVCLPLAALSKENGALLAPLALLVELFLFRFEGPRRIRLILYTTFAVFVVLPAVALGVILLGRPDLLMYKYVARDFTLGERLLTESRVLFLYLQQILVPVQRTMGFFHDDIVVSRGWLTPATTLPCVAGMAGLVTAAWLARRRAPLLGLGILFFFVGHALESTIFPLELAFEHRNYVPSYGVLLATAVGLGRLVRGNGARVGLSAVTVAALATLTLFRVETWASEMQLYAYAYRAHPQSDRVNAVWAERLTRAGRYEAALALLRGRTGAGPAFHSLYIQCRDAGRAPDADLEAAARALSSFIDDYAASGLMAVGKLGLTGHCEFSDERYTELLGQVLELGIGDPDTRQAIGLYRAHYLNGQGRQEQAIAALHDAHAVKPRNPMPLFLATEWLIDRGALEQAQSEFARAVQAAEASRFSYQAPVERVRARLERARRAGGADQDSITATSGE